MNTQQSIYLADMGACLPATALSEHQEPGRWFLVDYESEEGIRGRMIYADSRDEPPVIELPVETRGWHRIYIGVNYTRPAFTDRHHMCMWTSWGSLRIKFSDDSSYRRIAAEPLFRKAIGYYESEFGREKDAWESVYEVYWRSANLNGQSIVFAAPTVGPADEEAIANVAWVRLEPMTEAEESKHETDRPTPETRKLAAPYCLGQLTGHTHGNHMYHPTESTYITDMIEPFRDSDFKLLFWECIRGDICAFRTRIGRFGWTGETWGPDWIDPLKVAIPYARECGLDIYISMRMIGSGYPFKQSPMQQNDYYYKNRQYAMCDEEGRPTSVLSLAYPNIRQHWVDLLREAVRYGADGVHLNLHRAQPFVLYEEPVAESFREEHGIDPTTLPFEDERWMRHRAAYVTQFMRDVRRMLDEEGKAAGKRLGVAVTFWRNPPPLQNGIDLETWIRDSLVDVLIPQFIHIATDDGPSIVAEYKKLTEDTETQLWPEVFPRTPPGEAYAEHARQLYDAGADGLSFWSVELRTPRASEWAVLSRLGHYDELERYRKLAPTFRRRVPLRELAGISTHFSHTDG